jgi:hypothetical protein
VTGIAAFNDGGEIENGKGSHTVCSLIFDALRRSLSPIRRAHFRRIAR